MNEIQLEEEIIMVSTNTIQQLFSKNPDSVTLYMFYHKQCKLQKTNQSFTNSNFAKKGLKWGDKRFKDAKRVLKELDLIEDTKNRSEEGKIIGHYIKLKYIKKTTGAENHPMDESRPGYQNTNALSSKRLNALSSKREMLTEKTTKKERIEEFGRTKQFQEFWNLYPKKVGKKTALEKYYNYRNQHSTIISGLQSYVKKWESEQTKKQFIPNPSTWINQERWNDEIETNNEAIEELLFGFDTLDTPEEKQSRMEHISKKYGISVLELKKHIGKLTH